MCEPFLHTIEHESLEQSRLLPHAVGANSRLEAAVPEPRVLINQREDRDVAHRRERGAIVRNRRHRNPVVLHNHVA